MPDETLQVAFEIKTACDEISRKLLRWHWERKPGAHSLNALLEHIAQRQQESPEYYERMPDLSGKTSWSQLDTTLCMRVLLDPEKDAAHPLDLLGNTEHPGAARRACNAVRTARNEAAHASDRTAGTVDARHKPTADDVTMFQWFRGTGCPVVVVANKLDKLKKSEIEPNLARIREVLSLPDDVRLIPFSAEKGDGRDELLTVILHAAEQ